MLKLIQGGKCTEQYQQSDELMLISIPVKYTYDPSDEEPHIYECIGLTVRAHTKALAKIELEDAINEVL